MFLSEIEKTHGDKQLIQNICTYFIINFVGMQNKHTFNSMLSVNHVIIIRAGTKQTQGYVVISYLKLEVQVKLCHLNFHLNKGFTSKLTIRIIINGQ